MLSATSVFLQGGRHGGKSHRGTRREEVSCDDVYGKVAPAPGSLRVDPAGRPTREKWLLAERSDAPAVDGAEGPFYRRVEVCGLEMVRKTTGTAHASVRMASVL